MVDGEGAAAARLIRGPGDPPPTTARGAAPADGPVRASGYARAVSRPVLLQPRWIVAHVMILVVVGTFPLLGMWQLDRWDQQKSLQARIDARIDSEPVPVGSVLEPGSTPERLDDLEFQPVTATGTYLADEEVAHRNRDLDGQGGFDWLTPLQLDDGRAILVRRGFVPPTRTAGTDPTAAPPPPGEVTVTGWLELSRPQPSGFAAGFAPSDPATGTLDTVFHSDVARIGQQTSADLLPMVLHLAEQDPPQDQPLPVAQSLPEVDLSQNVSYAVQWFVFTAIAILGYAIVLRLKWRERVEDDEEHDEPGADDAAGDPDRAGHAAGLGPSGRR